MNINQNSTRTSSSYPLRDVPTEARRSTPLKSPSSNKPHAQNSAGILRKPQATTSTAQYAGIALITTALQGMTRALASLTATIKMFLSALDQKQPKPDAPPIVTQPDTNAKTVTDIKTNTEPSTNTDEITQTPENGYEPVGHGPYRPSELLSGFWQKRGTMNCVTVAGIKAAMQRFGGPREIYSSVRRTQDGYDVIMRDNTNKTYQVTNRELAYATSQSGFSGNNKQILDNANFLYAVSAKRAQIENNDGVANRGFEEAVATLDTWEYTLEGLNRLGLKNHVDMTIARDLIHGAAGVMASNNHVVTVLSGATDDYGNRGYTPHPFAQAYKLI
ncbi:hypothetical protein [Pseudomonas graminis]